MNYRNFIHRFGFIYRPIKKAIRDAIKKRKIYKDTLRLDSLMVSTVEGRNRVFYLGITAHSNLGDMAQHYCITEWIKENYPDYELVMFESDTVVDSRFNFIEKFKKLYRDCDIIIFQSGYCTQDLGGDHPLMHRLVCEYMTDAKILMMPQTIFFQHEENRRICAENHNKAMNMLFLARDYNSYEKAKQMFTNIRVEAFPDIVTTLIGEMEFSNPRHGVCLCTRNDGEKFYSKEQIDALAKRFESNKIEVHQKDTQGKGTIQDIRSRLQYYIEKEIESYSHFKVTITDRYHGTIFSLCAGTPVIIIKTTDHKVTTGADWFKGVYDDYVYVAKGLDDAYRKATDICEGFIYKSLQPYFKEKYYDKLKSLFENNMHK